MKFNKKIIKTEIIKNYIKENELNIKDFCKLCGICQTTYYKIINNENFILSSLFKIARVIKIHPYKLFNA